MKKMARWVGYGLLGIVGFLVLAAAGVYGVSELRFRKTYDLPQGIVAARNDSEAVTRGRHIAITRGCVDCHSENLAGAMVIDDPLAGRISGTNLTRGRGGVAATYDDNGWATAIRHGLRSDGKPLIFMPSHEFYPLSDEDVGDLIAYIKSVDPVDNETAPQRVGPLGRILYLTGQMPIIPAELIDHESPRPAAPAAGPTEAYGAYLATGCIGCHGPGYSGGRIPGTPPSFPFVRNITSDDETGIGRWTEADFFRAMREGRRPDGSELDPFMPVQYTRVMTDDEIRAIWLYLRTIPPKTQGNR